MSTASSMPEAARLAAQSLPPSARVFSRLQTLLHVPYASLGDIVDLVRIDSGLAAAVLRVANSAFHRAGEPLSSVNDAINRVGLREVHRIVGMAVSSQLFVHALPLYRLSGQTLWENSLATATAMSVLARLAGEDERTAYTLGLLRPTGRLVLQRVADSASPPPHPVPDSTLSAAVEAAWERKEFGLANHELGALLLGEWRFAPSLCAALLHHREPERQPGEGRLGALLHLACWVAAELGKGLPSEQTLWHVTPSIAAQAGLAVEDAESALLDTRAEMNRLGSLLGRPTGAAVA